jgi:hypothetical protein
VSWLWVYWPAALGFVAFAVFGIPEYAAIRYGGPTFSRFMATVANAGAIGKLWVLAWGMLIGGLAVHFLGWCEFCAGK